MRNPNQPTEIEDREKLVRVPFANMYTRATWDTAAEQVQVIANSDTGYEFSAWEQDFHSPRECPAGMYAVIEAKHLNMNMAIPFTAPMIDPELSALDLNNYEIGKLLLKPTTFLHLLLRQTVSYNRERIGNPNLTDWEVNQEMRLKMEQVHLRLKRWPEPAQLVTKEAVGFNFDGAVFLEKFRDLANQYCIERALKHDPLFRFTLGNIMDSVRPFYEQIAHLYYTETSGSANFEVFVESAIDEAHLAAVSDALAETNFHIIQHVSTVHLSTHMHERADPKSFRLRVNWKPL